MDYYQSSNDPFKLKDVSTDKDLESFEYRQKVL